MEDNYTLLKVSTYAKQRQVSVQYIYRLIKQRKVDAIQIDGIWFIKDKINVKV